MSIGHGSDSKVRVLHLEDNHDHAALVKHHLSRANVPFEYECVSTGCDYHAAICHNKYDIILADYRVPNFDGVQAYTLAAERCPDVPFFLVSSVMPVEAVDRCFQRGAANVLLKENLNRLAPILRHASRQSQQRKERERMQEEWTQFITLAQDCFCVLTPQGTFKRLSPAWERLTGFSAETLQSTAFTIFIHVEERGVVRDELQKLVSGRGPNCCFEARFGC